MFKLKLKFDDGFSILEALLILLAIIILIFVGFEVYQHLEKKNLTKTNQASSSLNNITPSMWLVMEQIQLAKKILLWLFRWHSSS